MNILGINFGHDASLALFANGELIQFEECERATRLKHQFGITSRQIETFLARTSLKLADLHLLTVCGTQAWSMPHDGSIQIRLGALSEMRHPLIGRQTVFGAPSYIPGDYDGGDYYRRHCHAQGITTATASLTAAKLRYPYLQGFDHARDVLAQEMHKLSHMEESAVRRRQAEFLTPGSMRIGNAEFPMFYVDHHFCHANYAYYYANEIKSTISTHDGGLHAAPFNSGGIYITNALGVIPLIDHRLFLGHLYDRVGVFAGISEPGKLMGLASYALACPAILAYASEAINCSTRQFVRNEIDQLVESIIKQSGQRLLIRTRQRDRFAFDKRISNQAIQAAANIQAIVETVVVRTIGCTASLLADIDSSYSTLYLTGGVTLNCPANTALKHHFPHLAINPLPACGDTGISLGACVAAYTALGIDMRQGGSRDLSPAFPPFSFNVEFSDEDYLACKLRRIEHRGTIPEFIAENIIDRKILCVFRGRSEVGPRALGRRSIIAHAIYEDLRDRINACKNREAWRPLAPMCRLDDYNEYFDGDPKDAQYMLFTHGVRDPSLKGVTHVDGSARIQSIGAQDIWLYEALGIIKRQGHVAVIINTSFNCANEPIVETIQNAFASFATMESDYLVTEYGIFTRQ